jgi:hypothetical protein
MSEDDFLPEWFRQQQARPLHFPGEQKGPSPYEEAPQDGGQDVAQAIDVPRQQVISEARIRANREFGAMMNHRARQQRDEEWYNPYREKWP